MYMRLFRSGCESLAELIVMLPYWFRLHLRNANVTYMSHSFFLLEQQFHYSTANSKHKAVHA